MIKKNMFSVISFHKIVSIIYNFKSNLRFWNIAKFAKYIIVGYYK